MTVSRDDVLRMHAEEVAKGKSSRDARQGTRTRTHEALHLERPTPLADRPTHIEAALLTRSLTKAENDAVRTHQLAQVAEAQMIASEKARLGPDATHRDAHHYVQKLHQKALWEAADKLVDDALGPAVVS